MKHIVMGKNSPMKVKYYNYRVEFQVRGAGHIHGVLWLDLDELDNEFKGLKTILNNLRMGFRLKHEEQETTVKFVDKFISCSLNNPQVKTIVQEVQTHHHSKTCRKYDTSCRFGLPRFPSCKTIIAQSLDKKDYPSEEDYKRELKKREKTLAKVKDILLTMDESFPEPASTTIRDILNLANVSEKEYYEALSVSTRGTIIILKRTPQEIYINNYNPEMIKAWNGNMDIQVCLDFFAVITYITDYYTKDESGTMDILKEAAKSCAGQPLTDKMRCFNTSLSNTQTNGRK